jgi:aspartyl-tRNA(Asn)/glutamyl-tRNA(Gln) amidotransferase subunit A
MPEIVRDPGRIRSLVRRLHSGGLSARALLETYLARIDEVESRVCAWKHVDLANARAQADRCDTQLRLGRPVGALHGIALGIKDVIDVRGIATQNGSAACADSPPASADAQVLSALRAAGAVVVGKTHTTEFAFFDPSPARNPHNTDHTPGGSSSGSAAAVAAGMVPGALGTQTVASVNRPAAYCGIAAFKPSTGSLSTHGVTPLAPAYDTLGFFGHTLDDAVAIWEAVCPAYMPLSTAAHRTRAQGLTVVRLQDPLLDEVAEPVQEAMGHVCERLKRAGHEVVEQAAVVSFDDLRRQQFLAMNYEAARIHETLKDNEQVGHRLREMIRHGLEIPQDDYHRALAAIVSARESVFEQLKLADAVLWPAAPDVAPLGLESTGDPRFIAPWTGLGGPVATIPTGRTSNGLPVGVLLCGQPGRDRTFARVAVQLAEAVVA